MGSWTMTPHDSLENHPRVLITAGPTWEPIDDVRFLGNRSSGRLGLELARASTMIGLPTTLLLGPGVHVEPSSQCNLHRFQTADDLDACLRNFWPEHDLLIMAAAVADYRPVRSIEVAKIPRQDQGLELRLEPTPDLIGRLSGCDHPGTRIGFALESPEGLEARAREKLDRKDLHAIVANPLSTMESDSIEGVFIPRTGPALRPSPRRIPKREFANWLLERAVELHRSRSGSGAG